MTTSEVVNRRFEVVERTQSGGQSYLWGGSSELKDSVSKVNARKAELARYHVEPSNYLVEPTNLRRRKFRLCQGSFLFVRDAPWKEHAVDRWSLVIRDAPGRAPAPAFFVRQRTKSCCKNIAKMLLRSPAFAAIVSPS
jgi:hypothetical protein